MGGLTGDDGREADRRCTGLLICPVCGERLEDTGASFVCPRRHTFDRARDGSVDLLPAGHGRSRLRGDTAEMLRARRRFLDRRHYEPLASAIVDAVRRHIAADASGHTPATTPAPPARPPVVLDSGCGVGYYLGHVMERLEPLTGGGCYFGLDISRDALRLAARTYRGALFFRNDVKHRICLADGCVDALLDMFAPRNAAEFARVLAPGGLLLVVIPDDRHLAELRAALPLLGIGEDKPERIAELFAADFEPSGRDTLEYHRELDPESVADLLAMTPSAWHLDEGAFERARALGNTPVTFHFSILEFRRADGSRR